MGFFKIELISDLCYSSGENFGSVIDTDIAFDRYGIPLIKGKTLKGCLRDCAEELACLDEDCYRGFINEVFGIAGDEHSGSLHIYDAHPSNYTELLKDVQENNFNTEQLLSCYTYVRIQTAVDENGVAKENSLRSTRVLKKGHIFLCEFRGIDNRHIDKFQHCLVLLRHMGLHRNRGFGEVKCSIVSDDSIVIANNTIKDDSADYDYLTYTITTYSPLIPAKDYQKFSFINASSMLGYLFQSLGKEKTDEMLKNGLKITNANISDGEEPFYLNPAFLAKQKTASFNANNEMSLYVFDTEICNNANPPALSWKDNFISENLRKVTSLHTEINYHHRLDENNPGQISGKNFYQLESICTGQIFMGKIFGKKDDLEKIYSVLHNEQFVSFGYYRSSGYGQCKVTVQKNKESKIEKITNKIAIWLHSPVVIYDDMLMPCAKPEVLKKYVKKVLPESIEICSKKQYLRFTEIGGYNVSWQMHKQTMQVYDAGTVFVYELSEPVTIDESETLFIGERTFEGFGECSLLDYNSVSAENILMISKVNSSYNLYYPTLTNYEKWSKPSEKINKKNHEDSIVEKALQNYSKLTPINATQVGRLLLMLNESESYSMFKESVRNIKKDIQRETSLNWIPLPKDVDEKDFRLYLRTLLTQKKFQLRSEE